MIANTLARSAFGILRRELASVFLVLPLDRLDTYARWLQFLVTQVLRDRSRRSSASEFALGGLEVVKRDIRAAALADPAGSLHPALLARGRTC